MTKVKMLTMAAGPEGARQIGQEVDVGEQEAKELIAGGYAVAVVEAQPEAEGAAFDLAGFLKQSQKKVLAGLADLDRAVLDAVKESETSGAARGAVLEAIEARLTEGGAGA